MNFPEKETWNYGVHKIKINQVLRRNTAFTGTEMREKFLFQVLIRGTGHSMCVIVANVLKNISKINSESKFPRLFLICSLALSDKKLLMWTFFKSDGSAQGDLVQVHSTLLVWLDPYLKVRKSGWLEELPILQPVFHSCLSFNCCSDKNWKAESLRFSSPIRTWNTTRSSIKSLRCKLKR